MKRFLYKLTIFWLPLLTVAGIAYPIERYFYLKSVVNSSAKIGIIGDSHAQNDIDPEVLGAAANFARRATVPCVWSLKIPDILKANPQLETFIVEICPLALIRDAEAPRSVRAAASRDFVPEAYLLELMHASEGGGMPTDRFAHDYIHGIVFPCFSRILSGSSESDVNDGFMPLDVKLEETNWWKTKEIVKQQWGVSKRIETRVLSEMIEIVESLKKGGIQNIVLVSCPEWDWYRTRFYSPEQLSYAKDAARFLADRCGVSWLDFSDACQDLSNWADTGHLNRDGARAFSKMLKEALAQ